MSLEALVGPEAGTAGSSKVSEPKTRFMGLGSELVKHEKSWDAEYDWKSSKMAKNDNLSAHKTMPLHQGTPLRRSNALFSGEGRQQEHMLSFSPVKPEVPILRKDGSIVDKGTYNDFPYYQRAPSAYIKNAGNHHHPEQRWFVRSCGFIFCFQFFFIWGGGGGEWGRWAVKIVCWRD